MAKYKKTGRMLGDHCEEVKKGNKYNALQADGTLRYPIWFLEIGPYVKNVAAVKYRKNIFSKIQCGVTLPHGRVTLFGEEYEEAVVLNSYLVAVKEKSTGLWGILTKHNDVVCKPKFDECPEKLRNGFIRVKIKGLYAVLNQSGQQICKAKYMRITLYDVKGDRFEVLRDKRCYKMNQKGVEIKEKRSNQYW
jgi:hypothetical protein